MSKKLIYAGLGVAVLIAIGVFALQAQPTPMGTTIQITTTPDHPVDFMHTKITIEAYEPTGVISFSARTVGLKKTLGLTVDINRGKEDPSPYFETTHELKELFDPRYLPGGESEARALRQLQFVFTLTNGLGQDRSATTTIMFSR